MFLFPVASSFYPRYAVRCLSLSISSGIALWNAEAWPSRWLTMVGFAGDIAMPLEWSDFGSPWSCNRPDVARPQEHEAASRQTLFAEFGDPGCQLISIISTSRDLQGISAPQASVSKLLLDTDQQLPPAGLKHDALHRTAAWRENPVAPRINLCGGACGLETAI